MSPSEPLDFGHPEWFAPPDDARRFYWSAQSAGLLAGDEFLQLSPDDLIADFGCGWGFVGHLLLPALPRGRVDGFDLDEAALALGRQRAREAGTRRLRFQHGDITKLDDVDDGAYDGAICQTVLLHQSDPVAVVREMARVVKPGGRVVLVEPDHRLGWLGPDGLMSVEQRADLEAVEDLVREGIATLGGGDHRIGQGLPAVLHEAGLDASTWCLCSTAHRCEPPNDSPYADLLLHQSSRAAFDERWDGQHDLYRQAGGPADLWNRTRAAQQTIWAERRRLLLEGTYRVASASPLYVAAATVPATIRPSGGSP